VTNEIPPGSAPQPPAWSGQPQYQAPQSPQQQQQPQQYQQPQQPTTPERPSSSHILADGEWHRLHPATPLLRGGIFFIAVAGFVIANLRERLVELFLPQFGDEEYREYGDPVSFVWEQGLVGWALLALLVLLLVIIGTFFLSWRMHTFRITNEAVEVRSGIVFRTNRKAKLDRVQGVNINKPFLARLLGAAKMEVSVAGQDANVKLEYLYARDADGLRRDVLTLASGAKLAERGSAPVVSVGPAGLVRSDDPAISRVVTERVNDFLSPELDPDQAPPESVVRIPVGRLVASTIIGWPTLIGLAVIVAAAIQIANDQFFTLFWTIPAVLGVAGYIWSTITKSLRYSIAGTPSGVRVGFGLLSTSNDTIPPGRVHAIEVTQSILWRPFGWWQVRINKAGVSLTDANAARGNTTILPVGKLEDVTRVLGLIVDDAQTDGLLTDLRAAIADPGSHGFTIAPRRARWLDPFAWKRTGFALRGGVLLFRRGVVWRKLDVLPLARLQSIQVTQGPLERLFRLSSAQAHTVMGPVTATVPTMSTANAVLLLETVSEAVVRAAAADRSHRWGENGQSGESGQSGAGSPPRETGQPDYFGMNGEQR